MNASRTNLAALVTAVLATSMTFTDATAVNQALPAIGEAMDASAAQLAWVIGACALAIALLLPAGALADCAGRRGVLASGLIMFSLASAFAGAAPDATWLIAARVMQGVGGAIIVPASLAVLLGTQPSMQRGRAIGVWSAWSAAATVAGPLLGGALAQAGLWRMIFFMQLPLSAAALPFATGPRPHTSPASVWCSNWRARMSSPPTATATPQRPCQVMAADRR